MSVDKICCIIDFDGFTFRSHTNGSTLKNEFLIREIGYVRIDPDFGDFLSRSFRFDLSFYSFSHCPDAWYTINHQMRYINGLSFRPQPGEEVHDYGLIESCVKTIYEICRQERRDTVAFKGGTFEKKFLEELGIPNLDLAMYGCPRYEELVKSKTVSSQLIDCGYHNRIEENVQLIHCPRAEVIAFRDWLMLHHPPGSGGASACDPCGYTEGSTLQSSPAVSCSDVYSSSDCD